MVVAIYRVRVLPSILMYNEGLIKILIRHGFFKKKKKISPSPINNNLYFSFDLLNHLAIVKANVTINFLLRSQGIFSMKLINIRWYIYKYVWLSMQYSLCRNRIYKSLGIKANHFLLCSSSVPISK